MLKPRPHGIPRAPYHAQLMHWRDLPPMQPPPPARPSFAGNAAFVLIVVGLVGATAAILVTLLARAASYG